MNRGLDKLEPKGRSIMDESKDIRYLSGFMRRRKKSLTLVFSLIFILAVVVAFVLPPIYLSQSTILIEEQQIPPEYVQASITGYVEERLQMITQQIMSRTRLQDIIDQFNLYTEMRQRYTREEIIEKMRDDINLETISADVRDRQTGRPVSATIAFTLSYEGKNPSTVQRVATVLASLYLEENLKSREERASTTTTFLQQELDDLEAHIDELQRKISQFKKAHIGELPEHNAVNLQIVARLDRELNHATMQLNSLLERKILLEGQIANVDPLNPIVTEEGKAVMHPHERLKYLRLELVRLQGSLSEKHPDVKKLKKEIQELEAQVEASDDSIEKIRRLNDLTGQLAAMKGKLGPKHPDVIRLSKEVEALSQELGNPKVEQAKKDLAEQRPENPAYINLKTQIATTEMQIKALQDEARGIKEEIVQYERRIERAPLVEREYNNLMRDYENAKFKYNEITNKLMEARVAQGMEETQRGERFTIIDPAQLPEAPYKPNRIAIVLIGLVLALGAGVGIGAMRENLDSSIKTADELNALTGIPVLSVIPSMRTAEERRARLIKKGIAVVAALCVVAVALYLVHVYVMPLEILWVKTQRRMMMGL
jgi:succinoglycan biosynthesis transport protein ExoP